eukprot:CAMPEP_0195514740 /NCGR_PEP_ID=MMETSP0794_2-20130614/6030_1 /TAXON_ID=515487 /ORGANISM="Stephanopyxis turris, Strain CCMP 815" /LENGTH=341 /DNA_ID=CAMNT_0040643035 /DNA_START=55 /DNA_END=1080 /DNA_ORIENTATION=-
MSQAEQDLWDAPLIALAQKSGGDLRRLLYSFFSFLSRRTDFYVVVPEEDMVGQMAKMGFREGDAEKLLIAAFRQFPLRKVGGKKQQQPPPPPKKRSEEKKGKKDVDKGDVSVQEQSAEGEGKKSSAAEKADSKDADVGKDPMAGVRRTEEGKQIPVGNGGCTTQYQWTQSLNEVSVVVGVPKGTRGKDLDVSIRPSSISVRLKKSKTKEEDKEESPPPVVLMDGALHEKIRPDECTWTLEGRALLITLDKIKTMWWDTVLKGDDTIDTTLVDSKRKIGTYDRETQGMIRKILFDQEQQSLGKPTSDEILAEGKPKNKIPALPPGVEFIDSATVDADKSQKK